MREPALSPDQLDRADVLVITEDLDELLIVSFH